MKLPPNSRRVVLDGDCDLSRKDELAALFDALTPDGPATIDLSGASFVDSTVFSLLAALSIRFQDVPVTIVCPNPNLRRVLNLMRFEKLFRIVDDCE